MSNYTKLELMKENKERYAKCEEYIKTASGLQKRVAETLTLAWIKGNEWMGGLSDSKANKYIEKLMSEGYELDEILLEHEVQMNLF